jgi:hypothetical protein
MKYVMFYKDLGDSTLYVPVIIPEHAVHADARLDGFSICSAGYFSYGGGMLVIDMTRCAASLGLYPCADDKELLSRMLRGVTDQAMYMHKHT